MASMLTMLNLVIPEELVERLYLAKGSRLDLRIGENYRLPPLLV